MAFKMIPCPLCRDKLPLKLNKRGELQAEHNCSGKNTIVAVVCPSERKAPAFKKADETKKENDQ